MTETPTLGQALLQLAQAEGKLGDVRAELHELTTNTQAELDRAFDALSTGRSQFTTPEALHRMALLTERLNLLDEVRRIVGF